MTNEPIFDKITSDLIKGDILRIVVSNPNHEDYGKFYYAICNGNGFGCIMENSGNAIFVHHCSTDLDEVIRKRDDKVPCDPNTSDRWEKYWRFDNKMQLCRMIEEEISCEYQNHGPNCCNALLHMDGDGNELPKPIQLRGGCCVERRYCDHYMENVL